MEEKKDYQDAYEKEHYKAVYLANRVAELEDQVDDLQFKLNRIKNNPIWKASGPARKCMHFVIRQNDRLKNCGSLSGVIAKVRYKSWEKKAMTHYGTRSFPSAEERQKQEEAVFERMPKISILVPLWNTPESFLTEMIGSVQWQTYKNWELCLADGSDDAHAYVGEYCKRLAAQDSRIVYQKLAKNEGISGNTNECYKLASGEFIGLFDHDDILHPCALYEYVKAINEKDADFIYCDEATFKSPDINKMITMHFKPDYAIDNLRANNYICHFSVFSRELLDGTELFRTKFDGSQDHDMILRLTDNAKHIVHVPKLLYYWRSHAGSVAGNIEAKPYVVEAARGAVADHLRRHGFKNFTITSTRAFETIFKISYEIIGEPKISVIIPNKDHVEDLRRCISSIVEKSTWENYEIIVVENNSETKEIFSYYDELQNNLTARTRYTVSSAISTSFDDLTPTVMKSKVNWTILFTSIAILAFVCLHACLMIGINPKARKYAKAKPCSDAAQEKACEYCGYTYVVDTCTECPHCGAPIPPEDQPGARFT